jgi:predicted enzyme related to lactoylglutathione lyase
MFTTKSGRRAICGTLLGLAAILGVAMGTARSGEPAAAKVEYRGTLLVQLRVANLEKAIEFYTKTLDFELMLKIDSLRWAELSFGMPGVEVGLGEGGETKGSGTVSLNIGVKDVDAARGLLERRGVKFLRETIEIPGKVKLADFADPDGNKIRLAQSLAK